MASHPAPLSQLCHRPLQLRCEAGQPCARSAPSSVLNCPEVFVRTQLISRWAERAPFIMVCVRPAS